MELATRIRDEDAIISSIDHVKVDARKEFRMSRVKTTFPENIVFLIDTNEEMSIAWNPNFETRMAAVKDGQLYCNCTVIILSTFDTRDKSCSSKQLSVVDSRYRIYHLLNKTSLFFIFGTSDHQIHSAEEELSIETPVCSSDVQLSRGGQ